MCALQVRDLLGLASTFDGGVAILPKLYCHIDRYSRCLLLRGVRVRVRVRVRPPLTLALALALTLSRYWGFLQRGRIPLGLQNMPLPFGCPQVPYLPYISPISPLQSMPLPFGCPQDGPVPAGQG